MVYDCDFVVILEVDELVIKLIIKYGQGMEEFGQVQFVVFLQDVFQDMVGFFVEKFIIIVWDVKLLNGLYLWKVVIW